MTTNDGQSNPSHLGKDDKASDPLSAIVRQGPNNSGVLDISSLTEEEQGAIALAYQQGLIDIRLRPASLGGDVTVGIGN
jgi:hypothetical protein